MVPKGELCCDKREWVTSRFRREGGTSTKAGVDFNDVVLVGVRVEGILNITFAYNTKVVHNPKKNILRFPGFENLPNCSLSQHMIIEIILK